VSLAQRVDEDLKTAMREKSATKLGVLRMLKAAIMNAAIEKAGAQGQLADADATQVIRKQVKQRQDAVDQFRAAGRQDLAEKEQADLQVLQSYLPQQMDRQAVEAVAREVIAELGASGPADMRRVMPALNARLQGRADGRTIAEVATALLRKS